MEDMTLQALLALAMFATTALAGLLPIKILKLIHKKHKESESENRKAAWCLTLLSCFAGGVFMGTCFLDIFPHVSANYARFREKAGWTSVYPFPEFFVCCGFFLVYFLEELCLRIFVSPLTLATSTGHGHSHGGSSSSQIPPTSLKSANVVEQPLKTKAVNGRDSRSNSNPEDPLNTIVSNRNSEDENGRKGSRLSENHYSAVMAHE